MASGHVLVTGGSRGIGRATALAAGAQGDAVTLSWVSDGDAAAATVADLRAAGARALAVRAAVEVEAEVAALFDAAEAAHGPLSGVVVNAGIVAPAARLADMSAERLARVLAVNVYGALLCAREAARRLSRTRGGRGGAVVFVSSAAARLGSPGEYVDYAASKGALDTLTVGLARELAGEGVRVNAVRPGIIATGIHASGGDPGRAERLAPSIPLGRAGRAEEVARAILWLLDDRSSAYVTGAVLDVAGGR